MNKISNDFVTIEYNSEKEESIAKHYIDIINEEPKYFKCILNGISTIQVTKLPKLTDYKSVDRLNIIRYILKKGDAKTVESLCYVYVPTTINEIYRAIADYLVSNKDQRHIYHDMAYDYLSMTGDSRYLKKFYFEEDIDEKDLDYLVDYKIKHYYDDLLKARIDETKRNSYYSLIVDNMIEIIKISKYIKRIADKEINKNNRLIKETKIDNRKFEKLVIGALEYIDPTNKLVEEYLEAKKQGCINILPAEKYKTSECHHEIGMDGEILNWYINLYRDGTLNDVKTLVHELAHHYYIITDRTIRYKNELFAEYASIYFEYKTLEYLEKVGYTKDEIMPTKIDRMKSNQKHIRNYLPSLFAIYINSHKKDGEYDIETVKKYVENNWQREFKEKLEKIRSMDREPIINEILLLNQMRTLSPLENDMSYMIYIIGTYYTMQAIKKLSHEDVLRVLEYIQHNEVDFAKMKELHGMQEETKQKETNKVKQKQVQ